MDHKQAAAVAEQITAGIQFPFDGWADVIRFGEKGWVTALLSRIVVLVGEQPIEHVSGWVEDEGEAKGEIVVLTRDALIRADFVRPKTNGAAEMSVCSVRRSTIKRVDVVSVAPIGDEDGPWPLAVHSRLVMEDDSTLELPLLRHRGRTHQSNVADVLPTLFGTQP